MGAAQLPLSPAHDGGAASLPASTTPLDEPLSTLPLEEPPSAAPLDDPPSAAPLEEPLSTLPLEEPLSSPPLDDPLSVPPPELDELLVVASSPPPLDPLLEVPLDDAVASEPLSSFPTPAELPLPPHPTKTANEEQNPSATQALIDMASLLSPRPGAECSESTVSRRRHDQAIKTDFLQSHQAATAAEARGGFW